MKNPFGTDEMAAGYATSRPAVHPWVIEQVRETLPDTASLRRALDIGCGAGVSTRALRGHAGHCVGIEPAEAMLQWTTTIAPGADFVVGRAEAMPIADGSVDIMTAAGSLNYANLDQFFPEAARVLASDGVLVVYDFGAGKSFPDDQRLDEWFAQFTSRYPMPASEARPLSPEILDGLNSGFHVQSSRHFEMGLTLTPEFYVNYMLTETNVAAAVRRGVPLAEIRSWCEETLAPVWKGQPHEVRFRGYFACLSSAA